MSSPAGAQLPIGKRSSPSGKSKSSQGQNSWRNAPGSGHKHKAWADYTPTQWMDFTPTPWGGDPYGFGPFAGMPAPFLGVPHPVDSDAANAGTMPAMPLGPPPPPAAGYAFGMHDDNPDIMPPPPHMSHGLPLHPPPRVAAMAAAAAAAAAGAAAAAAAACDVNAVGAGRDGGDSRRAYFGGDTSHSGSTGPSGSNDGSTMVKNTFIHVDDDCDPDAMQLPKSKTMPDMYKRPQTPQRPTYSENDSPAHDQASDAEYDESADPSSCPSRGSNMHGSGKCRPCAWFWKAQGCQNDTECGYCHLCPDGELKLRKKSKVQAMRMGALVPAGQSMHHNTQASSHGRVLKLSPLI